MKAFRAALKTWLNVYGAEQHGRKKASIVLEQLLQRLDERQAAAASAASTSSSSSSSGDEWSGSTNPISLEQLLLPPTTDEGQSPTSEGNRYVHRYNGLRGGKRKILRPKIVKKKKKLIKRPEVVSPLDEANVAGSGTSTPAPRRRITKSRREIREPAPVQDDASPLPRLSGLQKCLGLEDCQVCHAGFP